MSPTSSLTMATSRVSETASVQASRASQTLTTTCTGPAASPSGEPGSLTRITGKLEVTRLSGWRLGEPRWR